MLVLALLLFLSLKGVSAAGHAVPAGCLSYVPLSEEYAEKQATTLDACTTMCGADNFVFAYWLGWGPYCFCDNQGPISAAMSNSLDHYGTCDYSSSAAAWASFKLNTYYDLYSCGVMPFDNSYVTSETTEPDVAACFRVCQATDPTGSFVFAFYTPSSTVCMCSSVGAVTESESVCSDTSPWAYYLNYSPLASGLARRRKLREKMAKRRSLGLCPAPKQACLVSSSSDEQFECIDTSSELESCAGFASREPLLRGNEAVNARGSA